MSLTIKSARAATGRTMPGRGPTGDPGLFGFLKGVVKTAGSFITGGPTAAVSTAIGQIQGTSRAPGVPTGSIGFAGGPRPVVPVPGARGAVQRFLPGGATGLQVNGTGMKLECPGGHHPNKSDYFLKDGTFVPKGTRCVKNRRRDPLNPRALKRAVARVDAGKTWQAKLREIETGKFTKAGTKKNC